MKKTFTLLCMSLLVCMQAVAWNTSNIWQNPVYANGHQWQHWVIGTPGPLPWNVSISWVENQAEDNRNLSGFVGINTDWNTVQKSGFYGTGYFHQPTAAQLFIVRELQGGGVLRIGQRDGYRYSVHGPHHRRAVLPAVGYSG